jgi:hypothetical protein
MKKVGFGLSGKVNKHSDKPDSSIAGVVSLGGTIKTKSNDSSIKKSGTLGRSSTMKTKVILRS